MAESKGMTKKEASNLFMRMLNQSTGGSKDNKQEEAKEKDKKK